MEEIDFMLLTKTKVKNESRRKIVDPYLYMVEKQENKQSH